MSYTATGKVHLIRPVTTKGSFTKREFVVETVENPKYPQLVLFEISGTRMADLDSVGVGDEVKISFQVRGREWRSPTGEVKFFTSLDVSRVDVTKKSAASAGAFDAPQVDEDKIPF